MSHRGNVPQSDGETLDCMGPRMGGKSSDILVEGYTK